MCGGGHAWQGYAWWRCPWLEGHVWQGGLWQGHVWQGACMAGGGQGRAWQERRPLQRMVLILLECLLLVKILLVQFILLDEDFCKNSNVYVCSSRSQKDTQSYEVKYTKTGYRSFTGSSWVFSIHAFNSYASGGSRDKAQIQTHFAPNVKAQNKTMIAEKFPQSL